MDESNTELKELESVHEKHKKRQEVCPKSRFVLLSCLLLTRLNSIFSLVSFNKWLITLSSFAIIRFLIMNLESVRRSSKSLKGRT